MATLTVLKFNTPEGAGQMLQHIQALQKDKLIKLQDAAIVSWPVGKQSPKTKQLAGMAGKGALGGAFWGLLFGLLFFVPFFGMALGAAIGTLGKTISHYGIDENFIDQVRSQVTEGTSALFLLTSDAVQDKVAAALKGIPFELIASNLTKEQEEALRATFEAEDISEGNVA